MRKRGRISQRPIFGTNPRCPDNPDHGPLLTWSGEKPYFCPHSAHGGNGKFFTIAEATSEHTT